MIKNILSEINFKDRQDKLKKKIKCENTCNITFIRHYYPKAEILQKIIRNVKYRPGISFGAADMNIHYS